jgi:hypothetical protein
VQAPGFTAKRAITRKGNVIKLQSQYFTNIVSDWFCI